MSKTKIECYLESLKRLDDWVTIGEWSNQVATDYPEILQEAEEQAKGHKRETTGIREIRARLGSRVSTGGYKDHVKVDQSERPKRVKYIHKEEAENEEIEEIKRDQIEFEDASSWTEDAKYRVEELKKIKKALGDYMGVSLVIDHAEALMNKDKRGKHHPDNMQILIHGHNVKKSNSNWKRFSFDEQITYLKKINESYLLISNVNGMSIENETIDRLFERLKTVY